MILYFILLKFVVFRSSFFGINYYHLFFLSLRASSVFLLSWLTYILVLLQAMKEEPAPDFKCRDKFLIQSMAIGDADTSNVENYHEFWTEMEKQGRSIFDRKIRCVYSTKQPPQSADKQVENTSTSNPPVSVEGSENLASSVGGPTAVGVSLDEAQNDFNGAKDHLSNGVNTVVPDSTFRSTFESAQIPDASVVQTVVTDADNGAASVKDTIVTAESASSKGADVARSKVQDIIDNEIPKPSESPRRSVSSTPPVHPPPPVPQNLSAVNEEFDTKKNDFDSKLPESTPAVEKVSENLGSETRESLQGAKPAAGAHSSDNALEQIKPSYSADPSSSTGASLTESPGIPPNIVIILCLIFFLIGYLFF